ncbi:MAG: hypothetical protein JO023_11365 [Chloroflexi bacterium]|nr:hypothetical protein [Chloroflexota bacterium]
MPGVRSNGAQARWTTSPSAIRAGAEHLEHRLIVLPRAAPDVRQPQEAMAEQPAKMQVVQLGRRAQQPPRQQAWPA